MSLDDRKDLPPINSPNFLERVREVLSVYLGNRGDALNRGVTLRDLVDSGMATLDARFAGGGKSITPLLPVLLPTYEADLSPPPAPIGFAVSAAISNILVECDAQTYTQGHGHAKSRLYGATWTSGDLPVFANAVLLSEFQGTVASYATNPATTWRLWLTWVSIDGVESSTPAGGTNGIAASTGQDVDLLLEALTGEITQSQLHADLGTRINLIDVGPAALTVKVADLLTTYGTTASAATSAANAATAASTATQAKADAILAQGGAANSATTASTKATESSTSATNAAGSASSAATSATTASTAATNAGNSSSAAATSATNAATYATNSETSSTASNAAKVAAQSAQSAALGSANAASGSASTATTKASEASTSATSAATSATTATTKAADAAVSATNAATSATNAAGSASSASTSAGVATTAKNNANDSATAAATSASTASTKASDAGTASTAATAAKVAAESAQSGAATSATAAATSASTASTKATEAGTSATAAATSATTATTKAGDASTYASNAASSASDAAGSATTASTQAGIATTAKTASGVSAAAALVSQNASATSATNAAGSASSASSTLTNINAVVAGAASAAVSTESSARITDDNKLFAQYTVKVDTNGYVSGFGLASTLVGATPYSEFIIRADKFSIASPSGPGIAPVVPFSVVTTQTTINGVVVPVGVYMDAAYVKNGTITNVKIANAAIDDAKITTLSATKLTAGTIDVGQYIKSSDFVSGSAGWEIHGNGTAEFSGVVVRGTVYATAGQIGGNTIDSTGLQSPGYSVGVSGWRLDSSGALHAKTGSFSGSLSGASITGASGTFTGSLSGASITGATGVFSGTLAAGTVDFTSSIGVTSTYTTPGTYTLTVPAGMTSMRLTLNGGGGGGGGGSTRSGGAGGGGGASTMATAVFTVTPGATYTLTVGSGGAGGACCDYPYSVAYPSAGTATSVSGLLSSAGGAAGGILNHTLAIWITTNGRNGYVTSDTGNDNGINGEGVGGGAGAVWDTHAAGVAGTTGGGGGGGYGTNTIYGYDPNQPTTGGNGGNGKAVVEFYDPNGLVLKSAMDTLKGELRAQGHTLS